MSLAALGITAAGALGQYALNQRSQKKAFQQNVDLWKQKFDETNKYNSPVQQVARLKEAGLNPAMMLDNQHLEQQDKQPHKVQKVQKHHKCKD